MVPIVHPTFSYQWKYTNTRMLQEDVSLLEERGVKVYDEVYVTK